MRLKSKKILPSFFFIFSSVILGFLIGFSLWTQVFPQELKSLIFYRFTSDLGPVKYCLVSVVALGVFNAILLILDYNRNKKHFDWNSSLVEKTKAMRPILLLLFSPLRAFVSVGDQPAWIADQTTFYFLFFFILVISWVFCNQVKGVFPSIFSFFNVKKIIISLWVLFVAFSFTFGYFSFLRLFDLTIEKPDSHALVTVFWNTAYGNPLRYTYLDNPRNWFGIHFVPLVFLFVPLYLIKISEIFVPILLQLIQVIIGASGVFPVFLLVKKKLGSDFWGLIFGLVYLLLPTFQFQILYDFHLEIISLVCILWSIYFLEQKKYRPLLIFLGLAIFSREEFALYASIFGLYLFFEKKGDKKLGLFLFASGFFYLLLIKALIIPYFGHGNLEPTQVNQFSHLNENLFQGSGSLISKLEYLLSFIFTQRKIQYLFLMFLPTGFLALLSPIVLFSLPFFLINLLMNFPPASITWHYQSWLIPILIWAAVDFVSRREEKTKRVLCAFLLGSCLLSSLYFGPINLLNFELGTTHKGLFNLRKNLNMRQLLSVKELIPENAPIAVDTGLAPFFANRKDFYLFPTNKDKDYIITSLSSFKKHPGLNSTLIENGYCLTVSSEFLIYRKQENCAPSWKSKMVEFSQRILPQSKDVQILSSTNLLPDKFPISPNRLNLPGVLEARVSLKSPDLWIQGENSGYLIESQILSVYPNVAKIFVSKDGRVYEEILKCSSLPEKRCTFLVDITRFINKEKAFYLKLYLFADSFFSKDPTEVKIERLVLRSLKFTSK